MQVTHLRNHAIRLRRYARNLGMRDVLVSGFNKHAMQLCWEKGDNMLRKKVFSRLFHTSHPVHGTHTVVYAHSSSVV